MWRGTNVECALLTDGKCSVYPVRPMQCAGHHSCDVAACEAGFKQPDNNTPSIPTLIPLQELKGATISGVSEALKVGKLKPQWVELHAALAALLRNPSHMAEWRSGRKLVKDAPELGPTLT